MKLKLATLALGLLCASQSWAESLRCEHLPELFEVFFRQHYAYRNMTDVIRNHTVEQMIKIMDPSKTMLLDADVAKIRAEIPGVFKTMTKGDCSQIDEAYSIAIKRARENEGFVRSFVGKNYKLDETVELNTNPDKRGYAKTKAEQNELLKKLVHFQISNLQLANVKMEEAKKQLIHRYELLTKRVEERKADDLNNMFAEAFASALDPHSSYLSADNMEEFRIQMQLSLEGIGASLSSEDGFTSIEDVIPGGGAEKSGMLRPKDKIMAVAQDGEKSVSTIDLDLRDVVRMIRGKKGTKVTLTILRQAEKTETFNVTIIRDKIDIKEQAAKITYETRTVGGKKMKIGVLDLPSFYGGERGGRDCYSDVKALLLEARKNKVDGLVLNLSRNGGGILEDAVKISGLFISKGAIVATRDSDRKVQILEDKDSDVVFGGPLVVLTTRWSASASEIVAGALKDYKRAIVVGSDHTFGKGSVQILQDLPLGLGGMKVTTGMFFVPGGKSTQQAGVNSDIQVPSATYGGEDLGEVTLDYSLAPQSIEPFLSSEANQPEGTKHWKLVDQQLIDKLAVKSRERVAKDPKFAEIKKNADEVEKNKGVIRLSELKKKGKKESRADLKQKQKDNDQPFIQEGVNIVADMLSAG